MKKASLASLIALFLSLPAAALAAVPQTLSFQARIGDNGRPVTGSHSVKFAFWDCDGSDPVTCVDPANVLWTETQTLTVSDGVLTAVLGADTVTPNPLPSALFNGGPIFLEVTFDGTAFSPRMAVHSVPFAMRAGEADHATTAQAALGVSMKTSSFTFSSICATSGCTGALGSITVTTPAAGNVFLQAFGYCNLPAGPAFELDVAFSTSATTLPSPVSTWWVHRPPVATMTFTQAPLQAARMFPAAAGANTFFLVARPFAAVVGDCGATIFATFVPSLLP